MAAFAPGHAQEYDRGLAPAVAVTGRTVVEVHKSQNNDKLFYRVGTIQAGDDEIKWGPSRQYDNGIAPAVAVFGQTVVEVHESQNNDKLFYNVGTIQGDRIV